MSNKRCRGASQGLSKWRARPHIWRSSIRSWYDCHSPVRATQHLFSCLFHPIYARAWLRWKGGKWWKLSCLFTSDSFHSSAKRVQAPNDTNSEMKAANLTVSGTELWCLAAHCLLGFTVRGTNVFITPLSFLSRWGRIMHLIYDLLSPIWRIKTHFVNSVDVTLAVW